MTSPRLNRGLLKISKYLHYSTIRTPRACRSLLNEPLCFRRVLRAFFFHPEFFYCLVFLSNHLWNSSAVELIFDFVYTPCLLCRFSRRVIKTVSGCGDPRVRLSSHSHRPVEQEFFATSFPFLAIRYF